MNSARCLLLALVVALPTAACTTVGETGRTQLAVPDSLLTASAAASYEEATSEFPQITSGAQYDMVQRVGQRIAQASGKQADWEFRLLDAPDVANAFALPGGKVAVYTGLLKVTQNEDALAAVVGHEVAHVTARHGGERVAQQFGANVALVLADYAASESELSLEKRQTLTAALGLASQVGVLLPFSRLHESEADEIGLRYLVRAGYDPNQAPALWERMAKASGGEAIDPLAGLLSTHPNPLDRAARLRELIPKIVAEETGS